MLRHLCDMNFFQRFFSKKSTSSVSMSGTEKRSSWSGGWNVPFPFLSSPGNLPKGDEAALALPAAAAAIQLISRGIAMLDRKVFQRDASGLFETYDHPVSLLMSGRPHSHYTWFDFLQALLTNACFGSGYAVIHRDAVTTRPVRLELIPYSMCQPEFDQDGELWYRVSGDIAGRFWLRMIPHTDMIHIKGVTLNGVDGRPLTLTHRATFDTGLLAKQYTEGVFNNQARPSIAIRYQQSLTAPERETLESNIMNRHGGVQNAGRPLVLDDGMEVQYLQWSPTDLAIFDFSEMNTRDCCRIFQVPPDMMAVDSSGTYAATKQRSVDFLVHCLGPWREKIEEEFNTKLFYQSEVRRRRNHFRFDAGLYLEMDKKDEATVLTALVAGSIMTPNEARSRLGLNGAVGGDELLTNINNLPLKDVKEIALAKYLSSEGEKLRVEGEQGQNTPDGEQNQQQANGNG